MSEKQPPPSGTMTADEAPDTVNMTGKLFAEKIDWLYSIAGSIGRGRPHQYSCRSSTLLH